MPDPMSDARLEEIRQKARLDIVSADTVVELLNEVERLRAELEAAGCEYCADPPPHAVAAYAKVLAERAASRPATSPETCPKPRCGGQVFINGAGWRLCTLPEKHESVCWNEEYCRNCGGTREEPLYVYHQPVYLRKIPCSDPFHSRAK